MQPFGRKIKTFNQEDGSELQEIDVSVTGMEFQDSIERIDIKKPTNKSKEPVIVFVFKEGNNKIELNLSEIGTSKLFSLKYFSIYHVFPPEEIDSKKNWKQFLNNFQEINAIENVNDDELGLAVFDFLSSLTDYQITSDKNMFLTSENLIWFDEKKQKHFFSIRLVKQFISNVGGEININAFAMEIEDLDLKEIKSVPLRFGTGSGSVQKYWVIRLDKIKEYINNQTSMASDEKDEEKQVL